MSKYSPDLQDGGKLATGQKVTRIAEGLAAASFNDQMHVPQEGLGEAIQARRLRHHYFPGILFGEPAWDMLLELLHSETENRQMTISELFETTGVGRPVALRWISVLESEGLVLRRPNPKDASSELIQLEPSTSATFRRYFDALPKAR